MTLLTDNGTTSPPPAPRLRMEPTGSDRVDLLIVPPNTASTTAAAAMVLAATTSNVVHAQHLLAAAAGTGGAPRSHLTYGRPEQVWETEGGHLHAAGDPGPGAR